MMRSLGAEVVLVGSASRFGSGGRCRGEILNWCSRSRRNWCGSGGRFRADQFLHRGNFRAHYLHTGPEFLRQSGHSIQAFCDFVGSGGTFAGCAAAFKEDDPGIQCYVVEPEGAAVLAGEEADRPGHRIQGGGYSMADWIASTANMSMGICRSPTTRRSGWPAAWPGGRPLRRFLQRRQSGRRTTAPERALAPGRRWPS